MTQTVKTPDGKTFTFPDGMPPDKMKSLMQQATGGGGGAPAAPAAPVAPPRELTARERMNQQAYDESPDWLKPVVGGMNKFSDFTDQVANYATLGLMDETAGLAKATAGALKGDSASFSENFSSGKSQELARKEAYDLEHPTADKFAMGLGILGSGGSGAPRTAALTATGKVGLPTAILEGAKGGATVGAISGAGEAEGDLGDRLAGAAEGGAEGAAGGGALGGLFNTLGKGGDAVRRFFGGASTARNVDALERAGITPTLLAGSTSRTAQGLENVARTAPLVDDWASRSATRTLNETQQAAENVASNYGNASGGFEAGQTAKAGVEGFLGAKLDPNARMPLAEAQRIMSNPTAANNFRLKERALYTMAENVIPQNQRFFTRNTYMALQRLANPMRSNPAVGGTQVKAGVEELLDALTSNPRMTFSDIQGLRTRVGNRLSGDSTEFPDVATQELKLLYKGLTDDMTEAADRSGPRARQLWERANKYAEAGRGRFDNLQTLMGANTPEQVYGAILRAAQNGPGKGNRALLQQARRSMQPDEWGDVVSGLVRELGAPTKGAAMTANRLDDFSPTTFMSNLAGLGDDQVRGLLFGSGAPREAIDALSQALANPKAMQRLQNFSNSANQGGRAGWYFGGLSALPLALKAWGGSAALNKMMTSPGFARWLADGYRIPAGNAARVQAHIAKLRLIGKASGWAAGQIQAIQSAFSAGDPATE